jgi:hypothetical protein
MLQNLVIGVGLRGEVMTFGDDITIIRGALNPYFVHG